MTPVRLINSELINAVSMNLESTFIPALRFLTIVAFFFQGQNCDFKY